MKVSAQASTFRENGKWGIKDAQQVIVAPVYDTIHGIDSTNTICLACYKTKAASANKFIKVMVTTYSCNYLNRQGEKLYVKTTNNDTCSVFSLAKNSVKQFQGSSPFFVASVKGKKFLLTKDFVQHTFKEYNEIYLSQDPSFYITQVMNEAEVLMTGLINTKEELIVPYQYSEIKVNPIDSLIIACGAGVGSGNNDDVFTFDGKKKETSTRHIHQATKNFLIHKIFEPKEQFLIWNIKTREEKALLADEVLPYQGDEVLVKIKNDWYVYDLNSHQKRPKNKS
jgi:hypothetical protein